MDVSLIPNAQLFDLLSLFMQEARKRRRLKNGNDVACGIKRLINENPDFANELNCIIPSDRRTAHDLLAIPRKSLHGDVKHRMQYFGRVAAQDWDSLFPDGDLQPIYYVYAHVDPFIGSLPISKKYGGTLTGTPFYIGKGCKDRAFDLKRNQSHGKKIDQLVSEGATARQIVHVFKRGLTEGEAFALESKLIYLFGTIYEKDRSGILLNLDSGKRPEFGGFLV